MKMPRQSVAELACLYQNNDRKATAISKGNFQGLRWVAWLVAENRLP